MSKQTNKHSYELFSSNTRAIIYNYQQKAVQRMLDFDYACRRAMPSVAAIVNPTRSGIHKCFWGEREVLIPIYTTIKEAACKHPEADVMINYASFRSAYRVTLEALEIDSLNTIAIIAEGIPEKHAKELLLLSEQKQKNIIGPATVGGIKAGCFKIGDTAGALSNILESRLHVPGFVGFVSKSGGMSNELYNLLSLTCGPEVSPDKRYPALNEGIAIGGDRFPGSMILDHLLRFEANPDIKMLVALGEVGGTGEYEIVKAIKNGIITKPIVMWVMGTCTSVFPGEVQFGHAGARVDDDFELASEKNAALREVGVIVPNSFDGLGEAIHEVYMNLRKAEKVTDISEPEPIILPQYRRTTNFISTISDDRGEEATYYGKPISKVVEESMGIGGTLSLLWFKENFPKEAKDFLEMCIIITADHGPAVSGAHNAIVAARAGKDLVASLASGLLTIGPRFGGAIDDAARFFRQAIKDGLSAKEFVRKMKEAGKNIPGIGHRIKSLSNPDKRVEIIKNYARENFGQCRHLNFALSVERETTKKKENLILNVDGCIGVCFLDMLEKVGKHSEKDIDEIVDTGYINALFILGRSIGIIGHIFDQKRLKEPLYRHPWDDIAYVEPR